MHYLSLTRLSAPFLNTCLTYLNTLTQLSDPYHNTCITDLNTLRRLSALVSQSEPSIASPESSANDNRVLRHPRALGSRQHPSLQSIRTEYYVTRVVSESESSITSPKSSLRHPRAVG